MIILSSIVFAVGYVFIALEHRWHLNKALTASALAGILWLFIALTESEHVFEEALSEIGAEIFQLIAFLLAAMTLVEILIHYRFFDFIRKKLQTLHLGDIAQLWLLGILAFFLSAVIDNLTTTIVMVQISRRFFSGKNLIVAVATIVISANAGGAFSPIGDVTTIMLWLAGKFTAFEIISWAFLPSLILFGVTTKLMMRRIHSDTSGVKSEHSPEVVFSNSEKVVVTATFASFAFPVLFHLLGLPPYLGLLFGLGVVGMLIAWLRVKSQRESHLNVEIESIIRRVDLASILFFSGILLAVGALRHIGVLGIISDSLFGASPELWRLVSGNAFLGIFSAVVDNIPLTAAAINIISSTDPAIWALLALSVGTGGSLLVIGSAAGVVAMGMVKEVTFKTYFEVAFVPALIGYITAILVWCAQYAIFR